MRRVEFLNEYDQLICEVVQEMNGTNIEKRWITHNKFDTKGRINEQRSPSACTGYSPTESSGWTTDPGATDRIDRHGRHYHRLLPCWQA
jgi:hypothetical protein